MSYKNIFKSFFVVLIAGWIIHAATNNYFINSWAPLDSTTWNNLWQEVSDLREELDALKTQVSSISSWATSTVTEIDSKYIDTGAYVDWEISLLTKDKPLIIWIDWDNTIWNLAFVKIISWTYHGNVHSTNSFVIWSDDNISWERSPTMTIIPSWDTVKLQVIPRYSSGVLPVTLKAFQ